MIKYLSYICLTFIFLSGQAKAQEQQFFETLYDVPLMAGMDEIPEMALSFDKPNGRISEAGAVIENTAHQEIKSFYKLSLSQMGWKLVNEEQNTLVFSRDGENLKLSIDALEASSIVRFQLKPQNTTN
jgi:hypothetical protein